MRAYAIEQFGDVKGLKIGDRPEPKAGARQVLVRMQAASLNYRDLVVMRGQSLADRFLIEGSFACFGCLAAIFFMLNLEFHGRLPGGMMVSDALTPLLKSALLILTMFTVFLRLAPVIAIQEIKELWYEDRAHGGGHH